MTTDIKTQQQAGQAAVNRVNARAAQELQALSPLHDTFRTPIGHRGFKKVWYSK